MFRATFLRVGPQRKVCGVWCPGLSTAEKSPWDPSLFLLPGLGPVAGKE